MNLYSERGFTVIEVIVSLIIVSSISIVLFQHINSIDRLNARSRNFTAANSLVQKKTEELRSIGFQGLSDGTTYFTSEMPSTLLPTRSARYTISTVDSNLKEVHFIIEFKDIDEPRTFTYTTYIGELGIGQ